MILIDGVWMPVNQLPKAKGENVYTLLVVSGTPTIDVSIDGGETFANLPDAEVAAPGAVDLVLTREASVRATSGVVQLA